MKTMRETVRELTAQHLDDGHLVMGECLSAVGWVGGTLPERTDMTELPCSDVANSGFAVGAALVGRRPIYVIRYQGFNWFNAALIVSYAAKAKAMWGTQCPLLVRSIAMEGQIGPVAGSSHHALYHPVPGLKMYAPMSAGEWAIAYREFMWGDDPVILSEHRGAWDNAAPFHNMSPDRPEFVLIAVGITRFAARDAAEELLSIEGGRIAVHHVFRLKPFKPEPQLIADLRATVYGGLVLDDDHPDGVAKALAHDLMMASGRPVRVLGLPDRVAGFSREADVLPPDKERIKTFIREICWP